MIRYPDGRKAPFVEKQPGKDRRRSENRTEEERIRDKMVRTNMGMAFESDVSKSCDYYREREIADIYKRPTPIKVVRMSKVRKGMIEEAYFQEKSTTDYVGIYRGFYVDFECKETIHDSIPYHMIREQQYRHLDTILRMGGIGFFLVSFKKYGEVYLIDARKVLAVEEEGRHQGLKRSFFQQKGTRVERSYLPPYRLIEALEKEFPDYFCGFLRK